MNRETGETERQTVSPAGADFISSGSLPAESSSLPASGSHYSSIHCGIAGWSYPDWEGYVYPPNTKDKLRYVAQYVDMIEVNSTFYHPPDARTVESWVERTGDFAGFFFTAKIHQDVTHRGVVDPAMAKSFSDGLAPMIGAGKLRHLLAQFRYDFADGPESRNHMVRISRAFGALANLTFEVRHISWQAPSALDFMRSLGITVANLDYPLARNSFSMTNSGVGEHAYLRLHGRNAKAWFSKGAGRDETYNYLYSEPEVDEIVKRAQVIRKMSKSLTIVANNHYQGKEAVNIIQIRAKLSGGKQDVPPVLAMRYPELRRISS